MKKLLALLFLSAFAFADEYYFVCNELNDDLEMTTFEQELTINTKKKFIEFRYITHSATFKNTSEIVDASYGSLKEKNQSIVTFNKISGSLTHYNSFGVNLYKCRKVNKMMP
tara:strand:+ start:115 stop:450 length:336 start_codon:yes stop_codon:yes gene_type:complete